MLILKQRYRKTVERKMRDKIFLEWDEEKGIIVKDTGEVIVDICNIYDEDDMENLKKDKEDGEKDDEDNEDDEEGKSYNDEDNDEEVEMELNTKSNNQKIKNKKKEEMKEKELIVDASNTLLITKENSDIVMQLNK